MAAAAEAGVGGAAVAHDGIVYLSVENRHFLQALRIGLGDDFRKSIAIFNFRGGGCGGIQIFKFNILQNFVDIQINA